MKALGFIALYTICYLPLLAQKPAAVYQELEGHYNRNAYKACIEMEKEAAAFAQNELTSADEL